MTLRGWLATGMIFIAGLAVAATQATQGSGVEGRWQGTMTSANGDITITYNFKASGQVLTGTEESPIFSRSISDGTVNGEKISFKTIVNGNTVEHAGTVSGDSIHLKNHGPYGEFELTIRRVSAEKNPPHS